MIHFRFLRMTATQLEGFVPEPGQVVIDSTHKKLYIGDGGVIGGNLVGVGAEVVNELIATGIDNLTVDSVDGLAAALADLLESVDYGDLQAALDGKVTQEDFDELETLVGGKADQNALTDAVTDLADQTDLDALSTAVSGKAASDYLNPLLPAKADKTALDALSGEVDDKGDLSEFNAAVATKALAGSLPDLTSALAGKANQTDLFALTTTVGTKQGKADFTTKAGLKVNIADLFTSDTPKLIKSSLLPSSVDDVLDYASKSVFPTTGEKGKIYIADDVAKIYRWSGTAYIELYSPLLQRIATQAEAQGLTDTINLMSPLQVYNVLTMVGVTKDENGKWSLIDEGVMPSAYDNNYLFVTDMETLVDQSSKKRALVIGGTAAVSTVQKVSGAKSLLVGNAGWLEAGALADLKTIGTGDYTLEFDYYLNANVSSYTEILAFLLSDSSGMYLRLADGGYNQNLQISPNVSSVAALYARSGLIRSTFFQKWTNIIIQRKAGRTSLYLNKVIQSLGGSNGAGAAATSFPDTTNWANLIVGRFGISGTGSNTANPAYYDNMKVSKVARY